MTRYVLRTDPGEPTDPDRFAVKLDWFDGDPAASNLRLWTQRPLTALSSPGASALMRFATAVAVVDRLEPRRTAPDGWTRDIQLSLPGTGVNTLGDPATEAMLGFLTGDHWTIRTRRSRLQPLGGPRVAADVVCLLSGGLDSLVGAIDLLGGDDASRILLVGVQDQPISIARQNQLVTELRRRYPGRVEHVWANVISSKNEETTRARSILFIAFGLLCASAAGPNVPLYVPENGMIGLNAPLIASRSGSASTRTTHPHFMADLALLSQRLGITNEIINPLRLLTKGEALAQCLDQGALRTLAPISVSCAHPTANRWAGTSGPCGYCFPCLIRRASMAVVGLDDGDAYVFNVLTRAGFLSSATSVRPASLRAVLTGIRRGARPTDALNNGPVPVGDVAAFADVHARGLTELEKWLRTATAPELVAWLA